jgi:hypothetical protein
MVFRGHLRSSGAFSARKVFENLHEAKQTAGQTGDLSDKTGGSGDGGEPLLPCSMAEYQSSGNSSGSGSSGSKSGCAALTDCTANQYELIAPSPVLLGLDSSVIGFSANRECATVTNCKAATQFESLAATSTSDRVCSGLTVCVDHQFQVKPPTATSNRICAPHTLCDYTTQFQLAAGTNMSDTSCSNMTACTPKSQYQTSPPTESSDRVCANLKICTETEYQLGVDADGDRSCAPLTVCSVTQYEFIAQTPLSDRVCQEEIVCTSTQSKQGTGKNTICAVGRFVPGGSSRRSRELLREQAGEARVLQGQQTWEKCESGQYISSGTQSALAVGKIIILVVIR